VLKRLCGNCRLDSSIRDRRGGKFVFLPLKIPAQMVTLNSNNSFGFRSPKYTGHCGFWFCKTGSLEGLGIKLLNDNFFVIN